MDTGELATLTATLVEALAEATDHEPCDTHACIFCGEVDGRDLYTFLYGLERAIGYYVVEPDARASPAAAQIQEVLARFTSAPHLVDGVAMPQQDGMPELDARAAPRLFAYLKGVSMDMAVGSGWPRIET